MIQFPGKWKADKWRGKEADGFIQYDGKGHMSVQLYPRDYKDFHTNKNIDSIDHESLKELTKFYQSNFVYFADYKIINDSTIEHTRISATEPKNWGTKLTRSFEFINDTLILTATKNWRIKKCGLDGLNYKNEKYFICSGLLLFLKTSGQNANEEFDGHKWEAPYVLIL